MEYWSKRPDLFLEFDDREILQGYGSITAKVAKDYAETEFEKYRIVQDRLFESDFDKLLNANVNNSNQQKKPDND